MLMLSTIINIKNKKNYYYFQVILCLCWAVYAGSYQFMKFMAKATYDSVSGTTLLDCGTDLNFEQGIAE